jgi:hypothetical protein
METIGSCGNKYYNINKRIRAIRKRKNQIHRINIMTPNHWGKIWTLKPSWKFLIYLLRRQKAMQERMPQIIKNHKARTSSHGAWKPLIENLIKNLTKN